MGDTLPYRTLFDALFIDGNSVIRFDIRKLKHLSREVLERIEYAAQAYLHQYGDQRQVACDAVAAGLVEADRAAQRDRKGPFASVTVI